MHIGNANPLTPKTITTQEAIISGMEGMIKSVGQTLKYWQYINHQSNEIGHICHRIMRITRDLLNTLSGAMLTFRRQAWYGWINISYWMYIRYTNNSQIK